MQTRLFNLYQDLAALGSKYNAVIPPKALDLIIEASELCSAELDRVKAAEARKAGISCACFTKMEEKQRHFLGGKNE